MQNFWFCRSAFVPKQLPFQPVFRCLCWQVRYHTWKTTTKTHGRFPLLDFRRWRHSTEQNFQPALASGFGETKGKWEHQVCHLCGSVYPVMQAWTLTWPTKEFTKVLIKTINLVWWQALPGNEEKGVPLRGCKMLAFPQNYLYRDQIANSHCMFLPKSCLFQDPSEFLVLSWEQKEVICPAFWWLLPFIQSKLDRANKITNLAFDGFSPPPITDC